MIPKQSIRRRDENMLFWRRFLKNPRHLGAIAPSSRALGNFICRHLDVEADDWIVEIGAGTGRFTQALLNNGIQPNRLIVVELDPELCRFLKAHFPNVTVIQGDASQLSSVLPIHVIGHVKTVVSGIPLVSVPPLIRDMIVTSCFEVLKENGQMLQFTYSPISPVPTRRLGLRKRCLGRVLMNMPPAVVWSYERGIMPPDFIEITQRKIARLQRHVVRKWNKHRA